MFQPFKLSDDSSRARASTRSSSDVTFATVAPGARRATVCTNVAFGRITRPPWMSSGVQNSDVAYTGSNAGPMTPITVNGSRSIRIVRPSTSGLPP